MGDPYSGADGHFGWLDQSSVGVEELLGQAIGVDVFPNPATNATDVVYSATGEHLQLTVIDRSGAVVMERSLTVAAGIQREHVDVSGLYTVRITDARGGQGMRRLLVQSPRTSPVRWPRQAGAYSSTSSISKSTRSTNCWMRWSMSSRLISNRRWIPNFSQQNEASEEPTMMARFRLSKLWSCVWAR